MAESKERAKEYQREKNWFVLINIFVSLAIYAVLIFTGLSEVFKAWSVSISQNAWFTVFFYFLFFSLFMLIVDFPLDFYTGYVLENKYNLSNQTFPAWLWEGAKKALVSFGIFIVLIEIFYLIVRNFPGHWWFLAWIAYSVFTLIMGKFAHVVILPLFYKYSDIENEELKNRIKTFLEKRGFKVKDVYSINFSKTTKKANAAFAGFGNTRRVILADTLIDNFSIDEIEVVVAHELGHCKRKHIWKLISVGLLSSLAAFYVAFIAVNALSYRFGFEGASDVAAFPILAFVFYLFNLILMPLMNSYSRKLEREADSFALRESTDKESFISAMEKLGDMNLADPHPHPVIEFLLYNHPAIGKRVKMAKERLGIA